MVRYSSTQAFVLAGLLLSATCVSAATEGRILSGEAVNPQASEQLSGEIAVFQSVGQGIQLSLAACADRPGCEPVLSEDELAKLIQTLDKRIEQLNAAGQSAEQPPNVDRLIDEYRQTRQQYATYMQQLRDVQQGLKEFAEEEVPAKTPADEQQAAPSESAPEPEKSARKESAPAPQAKPEPEPEFKNEGFSIESFEDVDEPIRSE